MSFCCSAEDYLAFSRGIRNAQKLECNSKRQCPRQSVLSVLQPCPHGEFCLLPPFMAAAITALKHCLGFSDCNPPQVTLSSQTPTLISIWGFLEIMGSFLGVPIIRTIVFWGLYWGSPIFGNYHLPTRARL